MRKPVQDYNMNKWQERWIFPLVRQQKIQRLGALLPAGLDISGRKTKEFYEVENWPLQSDAFIQF